jgi:HK97 family phage prohead protease
MKMKYLRGKIEIKQSENKVTVVASDETLDRHGDVLPIDQWDISKFKGSPRMLVDHDHSVSSIVGKWDNVRMQGKQLLMDANFHGITELSKAVQQMVNEGYLDTVSVGFIPHGPEKDGDRGSFELIETSWVTVPANPNARIQASLKELLSKAANDADTEKIKEYMGEELADTPSEEEEREDEGDDVEVPPQIVEASLVGTVEDFNKITDKNIAVRCEYSFVESLIADSEKLKTLTEAGKSKVEADKGVKLTRLALKEASRIVNDSLRKLNKVPA